MNIGLPCLADTTSTRQWKISGRTWDIHRGNHYYTYYTITIIKHKIMCQFFLIFPITGPRPDLGISDWSNRKFEDDWEFIHEKRQATGFLKRPSAKKDHSLFQSKFSSM
jgi:hypothetical protein